MFYRGEGTVTDTESRPGWAFQMMIEPDYAADPRPYFDAMRRMPPGRDEFVAEDRKASVLISRYEHVEAVLRNPGLFSSRFGEGIGALGNERPMIPLQVDPPEHKKYRVLLDPYLAPRRVARLEPEVNQLVNELIDRIAGRGGCEFNSEFAVPLPCTVFLALLGLPLKDLDFFLRIKEGIVRGNSERTLEKQSRARVAAGKECYAYFDTALDRIREQRTPGLLLDLMEAEVAGERLTRDEIMDICYLLLIAGLDTVTDSLCCFWAFLAGSPAHRQEIVADPSIIPSAVEELMRWESPVGGIARVATGETEIGGCPVHEGENLLVLVGSANLDTDAIAGADRVDFHREPNRHYAFGGGIHRCLGSHLARLELRVALREWHRRIPEYHIPPGTRLNWTPVLRTVTELPLSFV